MKEVALLQTSNYFKMCVQGANAIGGIDLQEDVASTSAVDGS